LKTAAGTIFEKSPFTFTEIKKALKKEIDVIYASWGSIGLPELRSIKKFSVPIVYEFLTYPTGFSKVVERIENLLNKSMICSLDGRIFASQRMLNYMRRTFDLCHGNNIIFAESYRKRCFYRKRLPRLSDYDNEPHLVFIGLDSYEVFPQIEEMLRRGIHVHVCETAGLQKRLRASRFKPFCHEFKRSNEHKLFDGSFATFMTQFDACLVTYDFKRATSARLMNSIPNRFSFGLAAGIPFVLPRGYLKACEDIIEKHQIGFAYANCDELKNALANEDLMNSFQRNAVAKSTLFSLESNFEKIDGFLRRT
jgi:hypothetical protein